MSPIIANAVGTVSIPGASHLADELARRTDKPSESEGKRLLARGTQHFTYSGLNDDLDEAVCLDCRRRIAFSCDTPWAEVVAEMKSHHQKFCPARIERGGESVR